MTEERVTAALTRLGGSATWHQLRREVSARKIRRAARGGVIERTRRGRYALPLAGAHRREAVRRSGVLSHLSAAVAHGWAVKNQPVKPWVTFRRNRHLSDDDRAAVVASRGVVSDAEREAGLTSPVRTVLDCARRLPFDEALAVADSAVREGDVTVSELRSAAASLRGPGAAQARRVALEADGGAANTFESVLRAICLDIAGLHVASQLPVSDTGLWARVDLGDERLRLALEAEGFASHHSRRDLVRDARRYTELTVRGWSVLRFSWEDVMLRPDWVRWALLGWLEQRAGRLVPHQPRVA